MIVAWDKLMMFVKFFEYYQIQSKHSVHIIDFLPPSSLTKKSDPKHKVYEFTKLSLSV